MEIEEEKFNTSQIEAIKHTDGPLLIIAGAGTGKTTVISNRIAYLILKKKINPENILALTFTEKAASEMEERLDLILPLGYTNTWVETFHSFCEKILRQEAFEIGLDGNYKLMTEAESSFFLKKNLFKFNLNYYRPLGNPQKFISILLKHFSRLKDEDISTSEYINWAKKIIKENMPTPEKKKEITDEENEKIMELALAYKTYEELKIQEGFMDFSDLISNTLRLFRERKSVLYKYQKKIEYILIDEFQDTNFSQNQLAILLSGTKKNIAAVGDDDQAIYRWRGASVSNMMQFSKQFPETKIITLTKNYRSTQEILDSAYTLIQNNNPDRLEVKEKINKKLISFENKKGKTPSLFFTENETEEAEFVVKKIIELTKKDKILYKDIAILVRANDHVNPFIKELEAKGISYQFLGPGQLFFYEEIKDLIAFFKVLYNIEDQASLYRVISMPIFNLESSTIATLLATAKRRSSSLFALINNPETLNIKVQEKERITNIKQILDKSLSEIRNNSSGQILYNFLNEIGVFKQLITDNTEKNEKKARLIASFFEKLKKFETKSKDNSVFAVVDWIDTSIRANDIPSSEMDEAITENAVNIFTIHASKGLEFKVVFLVNLVKDRFPSLRRQEQIPIPDELIKEILPQNDYHEQEERRLFYVGMTRACEMLFFSAARFYGHGKRERKISKFVLEALGVEKIEDINTEHLVKQLELKDLFSNEEKKDTSTKELGNKINISYLSYSQIQTFNICPLHYKLKYILKIPTLQTSSQSFGTSIHAVLRDFYANKNNDLSTENIQRLFKNNWNPEGYDTKEHEELAQKRAISVVTKFLENDIKNNPPITIEQPFEFFLNNKLRIGGRIDRINKLDNNVIEIVDYKTGGNILDKNELKNNLQLTIYALEASNMQNLISYNIEQLILSLYYVEKNIKLSTSRTVEQLEKAKIEILAKAEEISTSDFLCNKSFFCENCEYKILCKR